MPHLDLDDAKAFKQWSEAKRRFYDRRADHDFQLLIDIGADGQIVPESMREIRRQIEEFNFALYRMEGLSLDTPGAIRNVGRQVGLKELDKNLCAEEDRLTKLTVQKQGRANLYIPYSDKAIGWHTDGYYNPQHQRVLAMVLHCEQPAASGGENELLDPDMVYIYLREQNPSFISALSQPRVMCIPENVENGELIRPQTCSAVFMQEPRSDEVSDQQSVLAMRFSKRKRHITWADDAVTREALECLFEYLESDSPYHVRYRLKANEGVINNNVLHTRTAFEDSAEHKRVYYRARYYNRISF